MDHGQIRPTILEVIQTLSAEKDRLLTSVAIIHDVSKKLMPDRPFKLDEERAILANLHDLFRIGHLSWGANLGNAQPPWCHVTAQGQRALANLSRDPSNPTGYLSSLKSKVTLNPIAESYIIEALATYNSGSFKASGVMVGVAAECVVLELRDALSEKLDLLGKIKQSRLSDWRVKIVLDGIEGYLTNRKLDIPKPLYDRFESHWPSFMQQIRSVRNESGHPISIEPASIDAVHASLLIFPELAVLAKDLKEWIKGHYS